jgi:hypothetical protein
MYKKRNTKFNLLAKFNLDFLFYTGIINFSKTFFCGSCFDILTKR